MASKEQCLPKGGEESPGTRAKGNGVIITVINNIQEPYFKESIYLPFIAGQQLIRYLEEAAESKKAFKFSATYSQQLGYRVNTINGLTGVWDPDRTWWAVLSGENWTDTGVSRYMPYNGDDITFKFTQDYKSDAEMKEPETEEFEKADDTNVRISVINEIQEPHFAEFVYLPFTVGQQLIRYLEEAAERSNTFKFSATYFDDLGYTIDTINGLSGKWDPDRTYWAILSGGSLTSTGVSSYMPENGEHITFEFTKSVEEHK